MISLFVNSWWIPLVRLPASRQKMLWRPFHALHLPREDPGDLEYGSPQGMEGLQPGLVGLRGALVAAWEADLRAVRQDSFDAGRGREALVFIRRFYTLISDLRGPIQKAWGPGGHVHVVDSPDVAGPGPRVSQSRIRLRNRAELVTSELFTYADGSARPSPATGLDREIKVVDVEPLTVVNELYRLAVDFLQFALSSDLALSGTAWLYERMAANSFVESARWPTLEEVYRRTSREFAVPDSFAAMAAMYTARLEGPVVAPNAGHTNGTGTNGSHDAGEDGTELALSIVQLQRHAEAQADLANFVQVVRIAVTADQEDRRVTSEEVVSKLGLAAEAAVKVGRLVAAAPDVCLDAQSTADFSEWSFRPSYNVHFFRRIHGVDDYLAMTASLAPRAAAGSNGTPSQGTFKPDEGGALPDGIVTFLMTDVVSSTLLWIQNRAQMYQAMRRHDQLLASAIEANGGVVLKERGEGDSFFAVFQRATDAVAAAVDAQRAVQLEPWPDKVDLRVRMAVLTGEADAQDRDYRSPAVNRCAKLRRRAVGNQILVSETTYSIVADILREDISLVGVGKRRLEGHDRPEEVYVVQHPEVRLEAAVEPDEVTA